MEISEQLIEKIVRLVVEEMVRQGLLKNSGSAGTPVKPGITGAAPAVVGRRPVISEQMVLTLARQGKTEMQVPARALLTPAAKDMLREKKMKLIKG